MSFPQYPEYKDSDQDWIGVVPSHWSVIALAKIASEPGSLFIDGDWVESKDLADEGIRYITTGNVGEGRYKEQGSGYISQAKFDELRCTEVLPGDVLISRLNLPIGRACVVPDLGERIITSVDNVITRPDSGYSRSYLAYMLSSASHYANMEILARGTTMQRISRSTLGQVRFAFPPTEEQTAIATFLDHETAKIDALVAAQERLIELLKLKRQTVIYHAVSKGLDSSVPMKDSGVEWLGEVPAHWSTAPVKRHFRVIGGSTPKSDTPEFWDGNVVWITPADLSRLTSLEISNSLRTITEAGLHSCGTTLVPAGSVVLSTRAPIGSLGIAGQELCTNQGCKALVPLQEESSRFLAYLLSVNAAELNIRGRGTTFLELSADELGAFKIPIPPLREQTEIAEFLDHETAKIDALVTESQSAIALLQERRTALISAAVTGQIDVRQLA